MKEIDVRIWLVGGGTAGHVVPLSALAAELNKDSDTQIRIITDKKRALSGLNLPGRVKVSQIASGKWRRYHNQSWIQRLLDIKTLLLNLRDLILVLVGTLQALALLAFKRPNAVLLNGGAIGLPVAWGCKILRVSYAVHESDLVPGFANRLAAGGAKLIMFGFEPDNGVVERYKSKMEVTGIQLRSEFINPPTKEQARQKLGLPLDQPLVLITGGSLGGRQLVSLVTAEIENLAARTRVVHITGRANINIAQAAWSRLSDELQPKYQIIDYVEQGMIDYMVAADVVVTRAGATTLAELAQVGATAIIVPNPRLPGHHQTKNAQWFAQRGAAVMLDENDLIKNPEGLTDTVTSLLEQPEQRETLAKSIRSLARPTATEDIARHLRALAQPHTSQSMPDKSDSQ